MIEHRKRCDKDSSLLVHMDVNKVLSRTKMAGYDQHIQKLLLPRTHPGSDTDFCIVLPRHPVYQLSYTYVPFTYV